VPDVPGEFTGRQLHSASTQTSATSSGSRVSWSVPATRAATSPSTSRSTASRSTSSCARGSYFQPKTYFGVPRAEVLVPRTVRAGRSRT
jgi:hypothetical protein